MRKLTVAAFLSLDGVVVSHYVRAGEVHVGSFELA